MNTTKAADSAMLDIGMYERTGSTISTFYDRIFKSMAENNAKRRRMVNKDEHRTHRRASSTKKGNDSVV